MSPAERRRILWRIFFPLVRALALFLLPVRVEGREHLPREGAYILVANHISWVDPPWIEFVVRRPIRYMGKREVLAIPIIGWALRESGVFAVARGAADRRALAEALGALEQGEVLGLFPEGHRSDDGTLIRARAGVGFLARRSGARILPVGVMGTRQARLGMFWRRDVTISFGEPFRAEELGQADDLALADGVMSRIATLLPPEQRGVYASKDTRGERGSGPAGPKRASQERSE